MALLASTCRRLIGEQTEKLKPGDDNYQQVPPHPQTVNLPPPLAPSVTCGDSSLPEGAMGCVPLHIGLCFWGSACCESLV